MTAASATLPASISAPIPSVEGGSSLARLFAEHHRRVLLAAYRITGSMADAEDVTQAVFLRLAADGSLVASNARSYLYRAAINGALDLLRRRRTAASEPLDGAQGVAAIGSGSAPEHEAATRQLLRLLRTAVGELAPRAAEIFTLRYVEELGNREIAKLTGTSAAVVAVTLYQTRSRLKKRLMELERERQSGDRQ